MASPLSPSSDEILLLFILSIFCEINNPVQYHPARCCGGLSQAYIDKFHVRLYREFLNIKMLLSADFGCRVLWRRESISVQECPVLADYAHTQEHVVR